MQLTFDLGTLISLITAVILVTLAYARLDKRLSFLEKKVDGIDGEITLIREKFYELGVEFLKTRGVKTMSIPIPDPELEKIVSEEAILKVEEAAYVVHARFNLNKMADDQMRFANIAFEVEKMIRYGKFPEDDVKRVRDYLKSRGAKGSPDQVAIAITAVAWKRIDVKKIMDMKIPKYGKAIVKIGDRVIMLP